MLAQASAQRLTGGAFGGSRQQLARRILDGMLAREVRAVAVELPVLVPAVLLVSLTDLPDEFVNLSVLAAAVSPT